VDALPALVQGYNVTKHRSIGMAPSDVTWANQRQVWQHLYGKRLARRVRPKWKAGDRVRLQKQHRPFEKGYLPGWTEEVFLIDRAVPGPVATYKIKEWDGTPVKGTFYEQDVQKADVEDDALFRVEKVLQRRRQEVKVRWKGWPKKYDSWIPKRDLSSL